MDIPEWALKFKEKGTQIHSIKGKFYLYKVTSKWDPVKKRPQKITEKFLGTITPEGLIKPEKQILIDSLSKISVKEYLCSNFIVSNNSDIIEALQKYFPDWWKELFISAFLRLTYTSPLKNFDFHYHQSFISEDIAGARMSKNSLTDMLKSIGGRREDIAAFFKSLASGSKFVLIDATHIITYSEQMRANMLGYNSEKLFDPQVNMMFIYSTNPKMPAYYRLLPGNVREIKAFKTCLKESGLDNIVCIADKGFYSKENIAEFNSDNNLKYIVPLRRNSSLINYDTISSGDKNKYDGFFSFENRVIWYYEQIIDNQRVIVFLDDFLKSVEQKDYLNRIEKGYEGYSKENFMVKQHSFGTLSLITNLSQEKAESVYQYYKSRNEIEVMFDAFKNILLADKSYMHGDYELECWMLISFISLIFYYRIYNLLLDKKMINQYSPKDFLLYLSRINKLCINNQWILAEIPTKTKTFLNKIGLPIT